MDVDESSMEEKLGSTRPGDSENLPPAKKPRLDPHPSSPPSLENELSVAATESKDDHVAEDSETAQPKYVNEDLLPPSRALLPSAKLSDRPSDQQNLTFEADVGISEYVSSDVPPIQGIIKQRCVLCMEVLLCFGS